MIISRAKRVVYIGVPHTGSSFFHKHAARQDQSEGRYDWGTTIHTEDFYLDSCSGKHAKLSEIQEVAQEHMGIPLEEFATYKVYCVVKHPAKWQLSEWDIGRRALLQFKDDSEKELREKLDNDSQVDWILSVRDNISEGLTFYDYLKRSDCFGRSIFEPYYCDAENDIIFLKFEDFEETYTKISVAFDLPIPDFSRKINPSSYNPTALCNKSKELIYDRFRYDFQTFNYALGCGDE